MSTRSLSSLLVVTCAACGFDDYVLTLPRASPLDGGADASLDGSSGAAVVSVFAGQTSACALLDGAAYCWGNNVQGALGSGDLQSHVTPFPVSTSHHFDVIGVGGNHACAIEHPTHAVYCWGLNTGGQLGLGDATLRLVPTMVPLPMPAQFLTAGYDHACAILNDGSLWCWGLNCEGQLGVGDPLPTANDVSQCVSGQSTAFDVFTPTQIGTGTDWFAVAGGQGHSCGLRGTGELWCWGRNVDGTLGLGITDPVQFRAPVQTGSFTDWTAIDMGQADGYGLRKDGSLYRWGDDDEVVNMVPTQVGTDVDWAQASTDTFGACAVKMDGRMFCWGMNGQGQLGVGDNTDRAELTPTGAGNTWQAATVGRFFTCATTTDRIVACTGSNSDGELGVGDTMDRNVFTPVAF